jgi:hypothetical protein
MAINAAGAITTSVLTDTVQENPSLFYNENWKPNLAKIVTIDIVVGTIAGALDKIQIVKMAKTPQQAARAIDRAEKALVSAEKAATKFPESKKVAVGLADARAKLAEAKTIAMKIPLKEAENSLHPVKVFPAVGASVGGAVTKVEATQ